MTGSSSAAIDIGGGGRRSDRYDSDRTSEDMSYIASPNNIGASFVEVHNESPGSIDTARATVHAENYTFAMPPLTEESDAEVILLPGEERIPIKDQEYEYPIQGGSIFITNYRIVVQLKTGEKPNKTMVFPFQEIEQVDLYLNNFIDLSLKGGRMYRVTCETDEAGATLHKLIYTGFARLNRPIAAIYASRPQDFGAREGKGAMETLNVFAWRFSEAVDELETQGKLPPWLKRADSVANEITHVDFYRLGMAEDFQISSVNENFEVCPTYPEKVIVPKGITDEDIKKGAPYRSIGRFPAVVWRCRKTKAILMRSSQPQVGILSWRNDTDEKIIEEAVKATRTDGEEKKQFVILDARGYTSAFANRARSGGFENTEYYQQAKLEFLGLPNIHSVRSSFHNIRTMLHNLGPNDNLLQNLQTTGWLNNISNLLVNAANCADHLSKGHSVLVHCSDGWDRTTQLTTLAKIMLDDHYRTVEGFEQLIRRDWIAFGHKLYDRQLVHLGNWGDSGERSPIFLQFLESVRHLQREQPTAFQFSHAYLIKLAKHAYSGLFGSFLFNSHKERRDAMKKWNGTLVEIWRFIGSHNEEYVNQSYDETYIGPLKPTNLSVINLRVWHEVFADEGESYSLIYNAKEEQRPSSGCNTPITSSNSTNLIKSKSSESINSLNHDVVIKDSPGAAPCTSSPSVDSSSLPMSTSFHQQQMFQSTTSYVSAVDHDGLIKFEDDEQAMLRKKNKDRDEEIRLRDKEISELRRRANSDKNIEGTSFDASFEKGLERVCSSMSIMDPDRELPNFRPNTTWEAAATSCFLCLKEFNKLSMYSDDRQHHCRNCGRVVCEECSKQRFAVVEEGQSVQKRVCDKCYESMREPDQPKINRTASLSDMSSFGSSFFDHVPSSPPASSPSSSSLNILTSSSSTATTPQRIPTSCKSSSNSISSPRPSPGEFSRHSSSQAVKG